MQAYWIGKESDKCNSGGEFEYRFTGKDPHMFLPNFMFLTDLLEKNVTENQSEVLHIHAYLCLCLRNAVSLFSRINITNEQVEELRYYCRCFCRGYWLFFNVNQTVWTIGHVVPAHTQKMKQAYGMGLGLNSMEGREAKQIAIAKYAANTAQAFRWEQVFHHKYISLIWLRSRGYTTNINGLSDSHTTNIPSYTPKHVLCKDPNFCDCGLAKKVADTFCRFCGNVLRMKIKESIEKCKYLF